MATTLTRREAGNYAATLGQHSVEIINESTAYGDHGWFFYIDGERCMDPRATLKIAREHLALNLNLRHQQPHACPCAVDIASRHSVD